MTLIVRRKEEVSFVELFPRLFKAAGGNVQ